MNELIDRIKEIMTQVSTAQARIEDLNDEYKKIYQEIDKMLSDNNLNNPNEFSDLWEFYNYWKINLKSYSERRVFVIKLYKNISERKEEVRLKTQSHIYVNKNRIVELKSIGKNQFDLSKLVKYCEELNVVFGSGSYLSTTMLIRAIIDHVPPIFAAQSFSDVSKKYGSRSFRESMNNLNNSSRKISDSFLHTQIRKSEVLPNSTQVDFSNDLDVLLAEIFRILK